MSQEVFLQEQKPEIISNVPTETESSVVFNTINELWPKINTLTDKQKDKDDAFRRLFNIDQKTLEIFDKFSKEPITHFNINLTNNIGTNLIYFLTKILYFQFLEPPYNIETGLEINKIKKQLGKDLHRINIYIKTDDSDEPKLISKNVWFKDPPENTMFKSELENVDFFNKLLKEAADKTKSIITSNDIDIIDIASIQQVVEFTNGAILSAINDSSKVELLGFQLDKKLLILITPRQKSVVWTFTTELKDISLNSIYDKMKYIPSWGTLEWTLTMNLNDLSYSLTVNFEFNISYPHLPSNISNNNTPRLEQTETTIQRYKNKVSEIGKGTINYIQDNPRAIASVGTAGILGSTVSALFLAALLGGKTRKLLRHKRKNRKSICKNKYYRFKNYYTKKTIRKNKRRKTKNKNITVK